MYVYIYICICVFVYMKTYMKVPWKKPLIGKTYEMSQLPDGMRYLQSGQSVGKVVVTVRAD